MRLLKKPMLKWPQIEQAQAQAQRGAPRFRCYHGVPELRQARPWLEQSSDWEMLWRGPKRRPVLRRDA
jgi:hypothetical protein